MRSLREFVLNSRHPDPRRAWKGGAEPRVVDQIIGIPRDPGHPGDPGDPGRSSQPLIPFEAVLKKSWKCPPKMLLFVLKQQKCNIFVFKKYKVAILGGEKAPAGVCTPILDF